MLFGYVRVSTQLQNIDRQMDALILFGVSKENISIEKMSGAGSDRPELTKLIKFLRAEDILVVESLSRLGRSTKDLLQLIDLLEKKDVMVVSIKEQIDTRTPTGRLLTTVLAALSQFERDIIVQRTNEGIAASRARGRRGGRPPISETRIRQALTLYDSKQLTVKEICEMSKISQTSLYNAIGKRMSGAVRTKEENV